MKFLSLAFISLLALTVSAKECSKSQFKHHNPHHGEFCLPRGGSSHPPSPPRDKDCPRDWQWNDSHRCCVPKHPEPPYPHCPYGRWDPYNQWCHRPTPPSPPTPSGRHGDHHKRTDNKHIDDKLAARNWRSKTISCPGKQTVCNVSDGLSASTWACVDTQKDASFCGGCGVRGDTGQDCTDIPNAWNVGCEAGSCIVFTCEPGFRVSHTEKTCVPVN